jgi:hypothetical protein
MEVIDIAIILRQSAFGMRASRRAASRLLSRFLGIPSTTGALNAARDKDGATEGTPMKWFTRWTDTLNERQEFQLGELLSLNPEYDCLHLAIPPARRRARRPTIPEPGAPAPRTPAR